MMPPRLQGLYLLLDPSVNPNRPLLDVLKEAVDHGVRLFQYRDKTATMREAYKLGTTLRRVAADAGALFIVNDRCDLALAIDADGAHVGQTDLPLPDARRLLGSHKLLGISTHTPDQVSAAVVHQPDYIAFGPVFPTATKPDHEAVVGVEGLRHVRRLTALPLFAIGGVTAEGIHSVRQAGADGAAVISAVLGAPDLGRAIDAFMTGFAQPDRPGR